MLPERIFGLLLLLAPLPVCGLIYIHFTKHRRALRGTFLDDIDFRATGPACAWLVLSSLITLAVQPGMFTARLDTRNSKWNYHLDLQDDTTTATLQSYGVPLSGKLHLVAERRPYFRIWSTPGQTAATSLGLTDNDFVYLPVPGSGDIEAVAFGGILVGRPQLTLPVYVLSNTWDSEQPTATKGRPIGIIHMTKVWPLGLLSAVSLLPPLAVLILGRLRPVHVDSEANTHVAGLMSSHTYLLVRSVLVYTGVFASIVTIFSESFPQTTQLRADHGTRCERDLAGYWQFDEEVAHGQMVELTDWTGSVRLTCIGDHGVVRLDDGRTCPHALQGDRLSGSKLPVPGPVVHWRSRFAAMAGQNLVALFQVEGNAVSGVLHGRLRDEALVLTYHQVIEMPGTTSAWSPGTLVMRRDTRVAPCGT